MIDEKETLEQFGYVTKNLSKGSNKKIIAICDMCQKVRILSYRAYKPYCHACSHKTDSHRNKVSELAKLKTGNKNPFYGKTHSKESKAKISQGHVGKKASDATKLKMSNTRKGVPKNEEHKRKIGEGNRNKYISKETRIIQSCIKQEIDIKNWNGFTSKDPYCKKFNNDIKEYIRNKYNRECFICNKNEDDNITFKGEMKRLSVHHVDKNRNQGCDEKDWSLIPLCMSCHSIAHNELWTARIFYLVQEEVKSIKKEKEKQ